MRAAAYSVLGLFMLSSVVTAQPKPAASADETALRAIEEKWDAASLKSDVAALDGIFADGFISTSPEGKVRTKAEILAQLKSGDIKYQSAKAEDLKVFLHGDTAIVNGRWTGKFVEKGKTVDSTERFTDTFVRQKDGQWRCVATQGSPIK